jgi:hypothetical protein
MSSPKNLTRLFLIVALGSFSCSSDDAGGASNQGAGGTSPHDAGEDQAPGDAIAPGDVTSPFDAALDGAESGMGTPCTYQARLVYFVTDERELYSFDPDAYTFTLIGTLDCSSTGLPRSMTIDRSAVGWTIFTDQTVHKFSTKDATCESAGPLLADADFGAFGMAFSSDTAGGETETLYTAGSTNKGLGWIDPITLQIHTIGTWDTTTGVADLTGTGDARLFAFFRETPAIIAEVDKATSQLIETHTLPGVDTGPAWAFAFWGSQLWLFTLPAGRATSSLTRWDPATNAIEDLQSELGFVVTGAGVSTCAPLNIPK